MKENVNKIFNKMFDNRYKIAIILLIICTVIGISGSSIGYWNDFMDVGMSSKSHVIFGKNRAIRSDEWAVLTPMFFSQVQNGFHYFNTALRASSTDVFIVYALPVISIFQIFRPFLIGFILFGISRGLSFFWCGRFIALFLVSIEFFMILTKKNKLLSSIGALMITLSPIVQWWFAVNGIAELFIFGEFAIVLLYKYLNTNNFKMRLLYLFLAFICAGGYALVFYPAWQIPMFYVYVPIAIWVIIDNKDKFKIKLKDVLSISFTIILLALFLYLIFTKSKETIQIVTNTVYPGKRFELGGQQFNYLFTYVTNLFLPLKGSNVLTNSCEEAMMFSLAPLGLFLSLKQLKKDKFLKIFIIFYILLFVYCVFGYNHFFAKITFLYNSQAHRSLLALGFMDVILLLRSLSLMDEPIKQNKSILFSIIMTIFVMYINISFERKYLNTLMIICLTIMCLYLFYFAMGFKSKYGKYMFTMGIVFVMFVSGFLVNPIRVGTDSVLNNPLLNEVKKIDKKEKGVWITEGFPFPINNYISMAGVSSINITNTYPDLKKWKKIDKEEQYKDIYNRYAHISMYINEDYEDKFELLNPDVFKVNLTVDDLKALDVKYIFTSNHLSKYSTKNIKLKRIYSYNDYFIYEVIYQ